MNDNMRILFMGGKNIGYGCLEYLLNNNYNVIGAVVNSGDEEGQWFKSVSSLCIKKNIPVYCWKKLINNLNTIQELKPDLITVVYFDQILKEEIINIPKLGCINFHMALAEEYRGCYPTTWTLINGETYTGVTLHYIDKGIDSGDIIAQKKVKILSSDTGKTLYDKCTLAGVELFKDVFPLFKENKIICRKQKAGKKYYKKTFPTREIDLSKSAEDIKNYVRALTFKPFSPPYFWIGNKKMIIVEE